MDVFNSVMMVAHVFSAGNNNALTLASLWAPVVAVSKLICSFFVSCGGELT